MHYGGGIDPFIARAVSTPLAMLATWRLNRALTFGASPARQVTEGARYLTIAGAAALLNYAIYSALLLGFGFMPPPIAVAISTSIVMAISYLGYSRLVFASSSSLPESGAASATDGGGSRSQSR
jgi:putative flippase GtrA